MKKHTERSNSRWMAHTAFFLFAATLTTGCASHRTIASEDVRHDSILIVCHDTVTHIQQVMLHDTVREQAVVTFVTDTAGHIIHQREVVHHYESHHHDDSKVNNHTLKDTLRTHGYRQQHSVVEKRHPRGTFQLILMLIASCAILLLAFPTRR